MLAVLRLPARASNPPPEEPKRWSFEAQAAPDRLEQVLLVSGSAVSRPRSSSAVIARFSEPVALVIKLPSTDCRI